MSKQSCDFIFPTRVYPAGTPKTCDKPVDNLIRDYYCHRHRSEHTRSRKLDDRTLSLNNLNGQTKKQTVEQPKVKCGAENCSLLACDGYKYCVSHVDPKLILASIIAQLEKLKE